MRTNVLERDVANLDHFKWNVAMEWRGDDAWTTRLSLMKTSMMVRRVALDSWRDDLLDISPMEDMERHFQHHMNIVLDDDDEELDCIQEGERVVDLVEAVLGFIARMGSVGRNPHRPDSDSA